MKNLSLILAFLFCSFWHFSLRGQSFDRLNPEIEPNYSPDISSTEGGLWMAMDKWEENLKTSPFTINDPVLNEYVRSIVCNLAGDYCDSIRIYIVRNPYFNASMAPNGMMQIWTGLLLRSRNEDQLATVLGHEIGHYLRKHSLKGFEDAKLKSNLLTFLNIGLNIAAAAGGVGYNTASVANDLGSLALIASYFSYNRSHEYEADKYGIQLISDAGYDSDEAAKIWVNLIQEMERALKDNPSPPIFFATHPSPENRIGRLSEYSNALKEDGSSINEDHIDNYSDIMSNYMTLFLEDELNLHQFGRSEFLFNSLLEDNVAPAMVNYYMGELYRTRNEDGDLGLAKQYYMESTSQSDFFAESHRALGLIYLKDKDYETANEYFSAYLERNPGAKDKAMIEFYMKMGETAQ